MTTFHQLHQQQKEREELVNFVVAFVNGATPLGELDARQLIAVIEHKGWKPGPTNPVALEVIQERERQDRVWGDQNHEDSAGPNSRREAKQKAQDWQDENRCRNDEGELTWDGVLLEEVYEAIAEKDPKPLREELIQVAAVAIAWIEALDRRK